MTVESVVTKVEGVAKTVETDVKNVVQLAELTYTQAKKPFLIGAAAGAAAAIAALLVMHFIVGVV